MKMSRKGRKKNPMNLDFDTVMAMILGGLFTGLGSAIGNYFAQRAFIRHLEKIK